MATNTARDPLRMPHVVMFPTKSNGPNRTGVADWLRSDSVQGEFSYDCGGIVWIGGKPEWDHGRGEWHMVVGFSDELAAFEYKMRWV